MKPGEEGDALRYGDTVDLSETNTARTQLVLLTGEDKKVLEVGPATGYITKALADRGCRVTGLEIDPAAAERTKEFAERMIVGDIEALDLEETFGDERFDVVMYGDVLEHLVDPEGTLKRTKSLLAPGGRVVASIPNVAHASVRLALLTGEFSYREDGLLDRTHLRFFTRESIHSLFETASYEIEEIRTTTAGPFGTEMGLRAEDFPPRLAEAVGSLPDADTYQFVLTAKPVAGPAGRHGELVPADAEPLWEAERDLERRERALEERESAQRALTEEVEWLRDVVRRAEEERDAARAELEGVKASTAYRVARGLASRVRRVLPRRRPSGQIETRASFRYRPVVSVVILEARGDATRTVSSVEAQTYGRREVTRSVSEARGDVVAFVGSDDVLAPFALHEVVAELNRRPELDVVYSDSDTISEDGTRSDPLFTPEWSPELLLSSGYMTRLLCVRREVLERVGGLRTEMGDEGLWDLALRISEGPHRISRVPRVLYHRGPGTPAMTSGRAVQEHLDRTGRNGAVERTDQGHLRVRWNLDHEPKVSLIIPTRHNRLMIERCLAAVERSDYPDREVLVIETAGRDADREGWYSELSKHHPFEVLWWEEPFNYSAVNNWGAKQATGDILLFLNDDTEAVGEEWLRELVGWAQQPEIGAVGAQLLNDDGTIQHAGVILGMTGFAGHLFRYMRPGEWSLMGSTMWYRNVLAVTGACLAMRREVFDRVGGWDERYLLNGSDVELGLRLVREGYRVVCTPFAQLRHTEQATRGDDIPEQDFRTSLEDYWDFLFDDPYWNPNLSYDATIPTLATGENQSLRTLSENVGRDVTGELAARPPRPLPR